MGDNSKIEWTDATWNPITGCTPVSAGCANCYARRMAHRLRGRYGYPADDPFRVTFHPDRLEEPLRWRKPRNIFVCSMGDLFHKDVWQSWWLRMVDAMNAAPRHKYILLTKRPDRMVMLLHTIMPGDNWFLGTSIEDQATADERLPHLVRLAEAGWKTFASCEPLLGGIRLQGSGCAWCYGRGVMPTGDLCRACFGLSGVIVGGESGPGARPMHPDWARSIRDQCASAGVPFMLKQIGEWGEASNQPGYSAPTWTPESKRLSAMPYCYVERDGTSSRIARHGSVKMVRVGKKAAGRILDGRTHDDTAWGTTDASEKADGRKEASNER